jgi:hypothetical protein
MPQTHNEAFLLSGILMCKKCGGHFVGKSAKSGRYFYYTCVSRDKKGEQSCSAEHLKKEDIEKEIIGAIQDQFLSDKWIRQIGKDLFLFVKEHGKKTSSALFDIVGQIKEKERRLKKLYDAIENEKSGLTAEDLGPRIRELKDGIMTLTAQETQLTFEKERQKNDAKQAGQGNIHRLIKGLRVLFKESDLLHKKSFLRELIDKIEIGDGQADIYWHIPNLSLSAEAESSSGKEWSPLKSPSKPPTSNLKVRAEHIMVSRVGPKAEPFPLSIIQQKVFKVIIPLYFQKKGLVYGLAEGP